VIVNHLRSLSGLEDADGGRIRAKRRAQAEYLATLIQTRQVANPTERIVALGDFNAFQFNDGYVDVMGTVMGTPAPSEQVVLASADLVEPNLTNLIDSLPASERYSFSFDGNAQALDQMLVNAPMLARFSRLHFARNDTDFPESLRNDPTRPERISDHDMPVAYFVFAQAPVVTLNGTNPLTVECHGTFVDPGATAHDQEQGDLTAQIVVTGDVDTTIPGTYTLTYSVSNGLQTTAIVRTVVVADRQPPVVTPAVAWPPLLVPANHQMADVGVIYLAGDHCDPEVSCSIEVTSNEPERSGDPGDRAPDWETVDSTHVRLRAEYSRRGFGRVYIIRVTCVDDSGNARTRTTAVVVPRLPN
jgi:hypothetical protein